MQSIAKDFLVRNRLAEDNYEEVRDFFHFKDNYVDVLDHAAEALASDLHEPLADARGRSAADRLPRLRRLEGVAGQPIPVAEHSERMLQPEHRHEMGAPSLQWSGFASWDDYLALLKAVKVILNGQILTGEVTGPYGMVEMQPAPVKLEGRRP